MYTFMVVHMIKLLEDVIEFSHHIIFKEDHFSELHDIKHFVVIYESFDGRFKIFVFLGSVIPLKLLELF